MLLDRIKAELSRKYEHQYSGEQSERLRGKNTIFVHIRLLQETPILFA